MNETAEHAEGRGETAERLNAVGEKIIGCAIRVHSALGPGLLESAYEVCLCHELTKAGLRFRRQLALPVIYDGVSLEAGYRIDVLVEQVVVEIKAVDAISPIHRAQILGYLRLGRFRLGYLLNFNVLKMKEGIFRLANGL